MNSSHCITKSIVGSIVQKNLTNEYSISLLILVNIQEKNFTLNFFISNVFVRILWTVWYDKPTSSIITVFGGLSARMLSYEAFAPFNSQHQRSSTWCDIVDSPNVDLMSWWIATGVLPFLQIFYYRSSLEGTYTYTRTTTN